MTLKPQNHVTCRISPRSFPIQYQVWILRKVKKGKKKLDLYSATLWEARLWSAQAWIMQFLRCKVHHTCLYLVKHSPDGATTDSDNSRLIAAAICTHLSTQRGWKAELALLAELQRTVYPYKWLPISCRSGAGQGKFAGQRPTFYHWATPPT